MLKYGNIAIDKKLSDQQGPSKASQEEHGNYLDKFLSFRNFKTNFPWYRILVLEEDGVAIAVLPRKEVLRRLRDRNEPILLFAETEIEAFRRLRKLEISEPEINRVN